MLMTRECCRARSGPQGDTQPGGSLLDSGQALLLLIRTKRASVGKLSYWVARVRHGLPSGGVDDFELKRDAEKSDNDRRLADHGEDSDSGLARFLVSCRGNDDK